jgi:hypothetical protein
MKNQVQRSAFYISIPLHYFGKCLYDLLVSIEHAMAHQPLSPVSLPSPAGAPVEYFGKQFIITNGALMRSVKF